MNKIANLFVFILALFIPGVAFILINNSFNFDLRAFIPMIVGISVLFAGEIIAVQRNESFVWHTISKSARDKMVFATSLILFWTVVSFPIFLSIESLWIGVISWLIGFLVAFFAGRYWKNQHGSRNDCRPRTAGPP